MSRRLIVGLALLAIVGGGLAAPPGSAHDPGAGGTITLAPLRVGDVLVYDLVVGETVHDAEGNDVTQSERDVPYLGEHRMRAEIIGLERVIDGLGRERDAVIFEIQRTRGDETLSVERCAMDRPAGFALRWDHVAGGPERSGAWRFHNAETPLPLPRDVRTAWRPVTDYSTAPCDGYQPLLREPLVEGEPATVLRHVAAWPSALPNAPSWATSSAPAQRTSFGDAIALEYEFPLVSDYPFWRINGSARVVFADGFPSPVAFDVNLSAVTSHETRVSSGQMRLVSYTPGDAPYPETPYVPWPPQSPVAKYLPQDPRGFDDGGLGLRYALADAARDLRRSPTLEVAQLLAAHPDARLVEARYEDPMDQSAPRLAAPYAPRAVGISGPGWLLCYAAAGTVSCGTTVRPEATSALGLALTEDYATWAMTWASPQEPYEIISASDQERLLGQAGIAPGTVRSVSFFIHGEAPEPWAVLFVGQSPSRAIAEGEGLATSIDLVSGRLHDIAHVTRSIE